MRKRNPETGRFMTDNNKKKVVRKPKKSKSNRAVNIVVLSSFTGFSLGIIITTLFL